MNEAGERRTWENVIKYKKRKYIGIIIGCWKYDEERKYMFRKMEREKKDYSLHGQSDSE